MLRKIGWGFRILYNLVRMPLLWTFTLGKIRFSLIEILSPNTIIKAGNGGTINLGKRCMFDGGTLIRSSGGKIGIGDNVYINRNCNVVSKESINIRNGVTIGPNVCIYDHDHVFGESKVVDYKVAPVLIEENVWIGANVVILKGVTIGRGSVIGAGAIITKDVPEYTVAKVRNEITLRTINKSKEGA